MNDIRKPIVIALSFAALLVCSYGIVAPARAADAEPAEIDPELAAKVAREKLKQRSANAGGDKKKADKEECGKIDIANDNTKSARDKVAPKNKTVIITGPIINATKC